MDRIPDRQDALNALARTFLVDPEPEPNGNGHHPDGHAGAAALEDEDVLRKLYAEKGGDKWRSVFTLGAESYYPSNSEAVAAVLRKLAFWTGNDAAQMDRIIRKSALYREKFDTRRGAETWISVEIARAIADTTDTYAPKGRGGSFSFSLLNKTKTENDPPARPQVQRFSKMGAPEPRRYRIEDLVPEAHSTVLYGDGGVAKSMLGLSAALTHARRARKWLGRAVDGGPALYVDFELDAQEQNRRVNRLARAQGLTYPSDDLMYMSALGFTPRAAFEAALEACQDQKVKLMVLDSLGPALQGDAEAARDVIGFYQAVLEPFRAAGVAVLVIDHQSKLQAGERYQSKRAFGSVFKGNLARSVIQVEATDRTENRLSLRLRQVKHNFGPLVDPFGVELSFTEEMVTVEYKELDASAMAEEQTLNATDRVHFSLKEGPAYPDDIAEATGLKPATVKSTLSKLRKAGKVEPTGERGKWGVEQVRLSFIPHKENGNENDPDSASVVGEF